MSRESIGEVQKFTTDVAWMTVSQAIIGLTPLAVLPALTKTYGSEIYGVWQQIAITIAVLAPVLCLRLETACVRFLSGEKDRKMLGQAFWAMLWLVFIFLGIVFFSSLFLKQKLSILFFADSRYVSLIPLTFLWVSTAALFNFSLSYLRARRRIKKIAIIQFAFYLTKASIIVALAIMGYQIENIIICLIIEQVLFLVPISMMIIKEIGFPKPNLGGLKRYLAYSIPLIPNGALLWIVNSSDRYFIVHLLSLSQAGIYSASYTLGTAISLILSPLSFVLFPTVSKFWEEGDLNNVKRYFEYTTKFFLLFAMPATAGLYIISQPLLSILTTSDFLVGSGLVLLIALSTILLGVFQINIFIIHLVEKTRWIAPMIILGALVNVIFNIILIPKIGIIGAAISTIISYIVLSTIVLIWAKKKLDYSIDYKFICKIILATSFMTICLKLFVVQSLLNIIMVSIIGAIIFGLVLWFLRTFSDGEKRFFKRIFSGLNCQFFRAS